MDNEENMIIADKNLSKTLRFKVLHVCEFTSTRKRMSIIFRDEQGKIQLYCKGADSIIKELLRDTTDEVFKFTQTKVDAYANQGLRTLFLASRTISQDEFDNWF